MASENNDDSESSDSNCDGRMREGVYSRWRVALMPLFFKCELILIHGLHQLPALFMAIFQSALTLYFWWVRDSSPNMGGQPWRKLKGNKRAQAWSGTRINDVSNSNYYKPCFVREYRHKSLILPDSEYAMKMQVVWFFASLSWKHYSCTNCSNYASAEYHTSNRCRASS